MAFHANSWGKRGPMQHIMLPVHAANSLWQVLPCTPVRQSGQISPVLSSCSIVAAVDTLLIQALSRDSRPSICGSVSTRGCTHDT